MKNLKIPNFEYIQKLSSTVCIHEYKHIQTQMKFLLLPGKSFKMGGSHGRETPIHKVTLQEFLICKYPVTQKVWETTMGNNPSHFKGENLPVEKVSWNECQKFCKKTGLILPTEAQWEYACRAGTETDHYWDDTENSKDYSWYFKNSETKTQPVGLKKPNAFGLHDMLGNVYEWCEDSWSDNYENAPNDGKAFTNNNTKKVVRGGCWVSDLQNCRSCARASQEADKVDWVIGFRACYLP